MSRNARISILAVVMLAAMCVTVALADEVDPATTSPARIPGFFETHYILTELIVVPIFMLLLAGAMASDTTIETIQTDHWSFWRRPLGTSYTHVTVPKEPSSAREIKNTLIVLGVIYLALRLTCLSGLFTLIYRLIGSLFDLFFAR